MTPKKDLKIWDDITIDLIRKRLAEARQKHPSYADTPEDAFKVVEAEFQEFDHACHHETPLRAEDEALDVIATCIRFINQEWQRNER